MMSTRHVVRAVSIAAVAAALSQVVGAEQPETVMITLRPKPGAERALAQTIARHYETAQKLNLLREDTPHLTLQASDDQDKTYFVDIFTWRDAAVPDNAPREIQAIWKEMNGLVEMRGGRPALDIVPVKPVAITSGK
ncbi:MAG: hypothetical protein DMF99_14055 [Acidobacteria bacterium]|nr:MAG: hypothetical protein DMG03_08035 [Acidobacteriota bacterium]PYR01673.1 MAG: hypothetical protein DMG00_30780 [Acidobacteriota bacterium]PYR09839.1 MAG: hypothetical protein DMF99_14055 [Acidobacteriota bacterium]